MAFSIGKRQKIPRQMFNVIFVVNLSLQASLNFIWSNNSYDRLLQEEGFLYLSCHALLDFHKKISFNDI